MPMALNTKHRYHISSSFNSSNSYLSKFFGCMARGEEVAWKRVAMLGLVEAKHGVPLASKFEAALGHEDASEE